MQDSPTTPAISIAEAYGAIRRQAPWNNGAADISHHRVLPFATYAPWLNEPEFLELHQAVRDHTLVDLYRCHELWSLARQTSHIPGDILEVGVWRGGTGAILAKAVKDYSKQVFLADTFTGVVKAGAADTRYVGGEHDDTSVQVVSELMRKLGLDDVQILEGMFPERNSERVGRVALLHCDVDVYQSTKDIVEWVLPRLSRGSIMVFDDYGFSGCEGVTRFCNEFRSTPGFHFVHNLNGHAVFVKFAE